VGHRFVEWDDKYAIGVEAVDAQHKGLFELTNKLHEACLKSGGASEHFKDALQKAVSYVALHFGTEERIMQKTADPGYDEHKREHDLFVKKVLAEAARLKVGERDAPRAFMEFLKAWISKHVTVTDAKIGRHVDGLRARGLLDADAIV